MLKTEVGVKLERDLYVYFSIIWSSYKSRFVTSVCYCYFLTLYWKKISRTVPVFYVLGLPWWLSGKEPTCQCRRCRLSPWIGKNPWRRKWQCIPAFQYSCLENPMDWSLADSSPWGCKKSDMTEHTHSCSKQEFPSRPCTYNCCWTSPPPHLPALPIPTWPTTISEGVNFFLL